MSLYSSAVKRPVMTSLCFVAVIILGLFSYSKLPIDLYPDIDTNTIMVMTYYNGASASDIEQNVSRPLENTLNSVEHLKHITSTSRENVSVITWSLNMATISTCSPTTCAINWTWCQTTCLTTPTRHLSSSLAPT